MRARSAEYELASPGTLAGVLALLADQPGVWTPIAGGTELMVQFSAGKLRAKRLVNIFGLEELSGIEETPRGIWIGAGTTYTALRRSEIVGKHFPLLALAASWTGSIANQNRGTLGGNLVNGSPAADSPPALLAYGAELELVSARGVRRVPYSEFHTGYKKSILAADELVQRIWLPWLGSDGLTPISCVKPPEMGYPVQYLRKVGPRNAMAISKVAMGAVGSVRDGRLAGVRIGLAGVSHAPLRCIAAETYLNGRPFNDLAEARSVLMQEIAPLDDVRSTAAYRLQVAGNLLEEFLSRLINGEEHHASR